MLFREILRKIRTNKKAQIILAGTLVALTVLLFFMQSNVFGKKTNEETSSKTDVITENTSAVGWEKRLAEIISKIEGVGKTDVMITFSSTNEKVTANTVTTNTSESKNQSGTITTSSHTTSTPILTGASGKSEPYVLRENMPEVLGVIVVASGADDPVVRLNILRAVRTALQVPSSCVEIYCMN